MFELFLSVMLTVPYFVSICLKLLVPGLTNLTNVIHLAESGMIVSLLPVADKFRDEGFVIPLEVLRRVIL